MEELLPAELTIDILSRLPVKTIIHCKCVCKKWRNLVLESCFVHLHLSRSPAGLIINHRPNQNDPGFLGWVEIQDEDVYLHLHYDPLMILNNLAPILQKTGIHLKGSVNGLICLLQASLNDDNIYICNPVTREYTILHRRRECTEHYGFGMSSMTGEYKVIRVINYVSGVSEAEVYTLGTGQWRSLGPVPYEFYGYYGPFLNNHCHWIASYTLEKICTFDFDKEIFHLFPSTPSLEEEEEDEKHYECLSILKSCLCKIDFYRSQLTIWVMKEYGIKESWQKEVVINQAISPHLDWPICDPLFLIEGLKDGSILMLRRSKLWVFYPNNNRIEDTRLFDFSPSPSPVRGMVYRPSFLKLQNFELERVHMF